MYNFLLTIKMQDTKLITVPIPYFKRGMFGLAIIVVSIFTVQSGFAFASERFKTTDILVLGDSQITFGSGPTYLRFFRNLKKHCAQNIAHSRYFEKLGSGKTGVIGVRSTSLYAWTARNGAAKGKVCDVDPKWNLNAGAFGTVNQTREKYVQIGRGHPYQFCKKNLSPLEAVFQDEYYDPKLLVLSFLGNSAKDWAETPEKALKDVRKTVQQIPENLPCIFMTTAPPYGQKITDLRVQAQSNLKQAFKQTGNRCAFVAGVNAQTIKANLGNKRYFKRHKKTGKVRDPFHPNPRGARKFFAIQKDAICNAVLTELKRHFP